MLIHSFTFPINFKLIFEIKSHHEHKEARSVRKIRIFRAMCIPRCGLMIHVGEQYHIPKFLTYRCKLTRNAELTTFIISVFSCPILSSNHRLSIVRTCSSNTIESRLIPLIA